MLSLFRLNDPSRSIMLLGLALLFRVPFVFFNLSFLDDQLVWIAIASRYLEGFGLYSEIWTVEPPLFSWMASLFFLLFGKSLFGQVFGTAVIVWVSALIFNSILSQIEAFKSKSYVPGAMFILATSISVEYLFISPPLVATPLLLLSLKFILPSLRAETNFDGLFFSGLFFSMATGAYLPCLYLMPFFILFLILAASSKSNDVLWWVSSFLFFWLILFSNYWLKSQTLPFLSSMAFGAFRTISESVWEARIYFAIFSPILFLLIIAVLNLSFRMRFLNYQVRIHRTFFTFSLMVLFTLPFQEKLSFNSFFLFSIPISYFLAQYFMELKRSFWNEFIFVGLFVLSTVLNITLINSTFVFRNIPEENLPFPLQEIKQSERRAMVFGDPTQTLRTQNISGPVVDWDYSKRVFEDLAPEKKIALIHHFIELEKPDDIVDPHGFFEDQLKKDPILAKKYTLERKGLYFKDY